MSFEKLYQELLSRSKLFLPEVEDCDHWVDKISFQTGIPKEKVIRVINIFFLRVKVNFLTGKKVELNKLGFFEIKNLLNNNGKIIMPYFRASIRFQRKIKKYQDGK